MMNYADPRPAHIPGYDSGPLTRQPQLLNDRLFWLGHLYPCTTNVEDAEELLFGADYDAAEEFNRQLWERADWPVFTIPLPAGHRLHVVYRTLDEDTGVDYLLHHPDWDQAEHLAHNDGHFMGPALSWAELITIADNALPGDPTTAGPHTRLLLLLPAFGDDALPNDANDRLTAALRIHTGVESPEALAAVLLEGQAEPGPVHWTTTDQGVRINDGAYSYRNPANNFALPAPRLARTSTALTPETPR
jgi:hypothetical protein